MRRKNKILVTFAIIGAATILIAWNANAQTSRPAMSVTDAKRDAALLADKPIAVRGSVQAGSIVLNGTLVDTFVLGDGGEKLLVHYGSVAPENFGPKDIVVNGVVVPQADGTVVLRATSIQVGCSSKY
jgi:cytochrome c-type biogenesis protein CcmE